MNIRSLMMVFVLLAGFAPAESNGTRTMPVTAGETLSGKHLRPADAVKGHAVVLIAGFSHDGGMRCGAWRKAVESDLALKDANVLELAMLEKAPAILRGMIKSGMRKGLSSVEQDRIVVMTRDQQAWEKYFGVGDDSQPYVMVLNAKGDVVWQGHGTAADLEPEMRRAVEK